MRISSGSLFDLEGLSSRMSRACSCMLLCSALRYSYHFVWLLLRLFYSKLEIQYKCRYIKRWFIWRYLLRVWILLKDTLATRWLARFHRRNRLLGRFLQEAWKACMLLLLQILNQYSAYLVDRYRRCLVFVFRILSFSLSHQPYREWIVELL